MIAAVLHDHGRALSSGAEDARSVQPSAVKSAARVLELLDYFDAIRRPARASEIASQLGYPQSSTSVLLRRLVTLGYMSFESKGRTYIPSIRVASIGAWLLECHLPRGSLTDLANDLSHETGHTVIIGSRSGLEAQYLHVVEATTAIRLHVVPGTRRVFVWSAVGFALMAAMRNEEICALVRRTNAEMMPGRPRVDAVASLAKVQRVRDEGYVYSRALITPGGGMICLPLPDVFSDGSHPLAIALAGAAEEFDRSEGQLVAVIKSAIARHRDITPVPSSEASVGATLRAGHDAVLTDGP